MSQYFLPCRSSGSYILHQKQIASKLTEASKLDIEKLTPVPNDLAKLSNVLKNDVTN